MFTPVGRLALLLASAALSVWCFDQGIPVAAWMFVVAAVLVPYGHFRYGSVWLAFRQIQRGNIERGRRLLAATPNPRWLGRQERGFYHFGNGVIALRDDDLSRAEEELRRALEFSVRSTHNAAMVHVLLTRIYLDTNRVENARESLREAERLPHQSDLDAEIARLSQKAALT